MFDHLMLRTQQLEVMSAFYEKALAPLGIKKLMAFDGAAGFGRDAPGLWISKSSEPRSNVHLALSSPDRSACIMEKRSPPGPAAISAEAAVQRSESRPTPITRQPCAASAFAVSLPMPELAPVTTATRRSRSVIAPCRSAFRRRAGSGGVRVRKCWAL